MKYILKVWLILVVFVLMSGTATYVKAQCATCAGTVETNAKNGGTPAKGLNNGILVLLAAPYLAVAVVGYVWYKKYRRKNVNIDVRGEKLHLN